MDSCIKVDVVYPLMDTSKWRDDWELRYSLRSLAEQSWVGKIWLMGHCPKWAVNVLHIPVGDPVTNVKDANIIYKVLRACSFDELTEQFVINSDDHYILRPVELEELGPWLDNNPPTFSNKGPSSLWLRRQADTLKWLVKQGYPDWLFNSHLPYLVKKHAYQEAMRILPWKRMNGVQTHAYYNVTLDPDEPPQAAPSLLSIHHRVTITPEQMAEGTEGRTFYNHDNGGLCPAVKDWLERRFPTPSKWEI